MTIMSGEELCDWLKISKTTLYGLTRSRVRSSRPPLPSIRVGKQLRFVKESVVEWLRQMETKEAS
jgi:excisionase family DNA binding protein